MRFLLGNMVTLVSISAFSDLCPVRPWTRLSQDGCCCGRLVSDFIAFTYVMLSYVFINLRTFLLSQGPTNLSRDCDHQLSTGRLGPFTLCTASIAEASPHTIPPSPRLWSCYSSFLILEPLKNIHNPYSSLSGRFSLEECGPSSRQHYLSCKNNAAPSLPHS